MAYGEYNDLPIRAAPDKVLHDNAFDIAKNPKHDGYQHGLTSKIYKFFDKKFFGANTLGGAVMWAHSKTF